MIRSHPWIALIVGVVVGGGTALAFVITLDREKIWAALRPNNSISDQTNLSGADILADFKCRYAENRLIYFHGIEDNFAPTGDEPSKVDPNLGDYQNTVVPMRAYDEGGFDRNFIDNFALPTNIDSGIVVIGMRSLGTVTNDSLQIGELGSLRGSVAHSNRYSISIENILKTQQSPRNEIVFSSTLAGLQLSHNTELDSILEYIQNTDNQASVSIRVSDDTMVDFAAIAVCQKPEPGLGLTAFARNNLRNTAYHGLECGDAEFFTQKCDPFRGDTPCKKALPVACYHDLGETSEEAENYNMAWVGGKFALTPPRRGDSFATIDDVDAFCVAKFGKKWRTATIHDGQGRAFTRHEIQGAPTRVWWDIQDQPYATCWGR